MGILLVEDDKALGMLLKQGLEREGYAVEWLQDGETALNHVEEEGPDLVVLDLSLPKMDGAQLLEEVHRRLPQTSVLVLTGRTKVEERVRCLDLGADDYLLKPFSFHELTARCRAVMRRKEQAGPEQVLKYGLVEINRVLRQVLVGGVEVELTAKEYALLEYLLQHKGKAVCRAQLLKEVWHTTSHTGTNVVDVYINYLRRKLTVQGVADGVALIETVRGEGYRLSNVPFRKLTQQRNGQGTGAGHSPLMLQRA
ncbi:response regulator transcription factor [Terriglobus tenax]|uniref:response regulator transcription factor n=1 Tax=Terriglobus tenax TaxID=1111115 RepID=UPI0021E0A2BC|nr:response regulator transcription factor [Terriglobus tenax]